MRMEHNSCSVGTEFLGFYSVLCIHSFAAERSLCTSIGFSSQYCLFANYLVNSIKKKGKNIHLRAGLALPTAQELSFIFLSSSFGTWMKSAGGENFTEKNYLQNETAFNKIAYLINSRHVCSLKTLLIFFSCESRRMRILLPTG